VSSTAFLLLFHFAVATPGFGAPVYAETVGPLTPEQCQRISNVYRDARPEHGRNDVACISAPDGLDLRDAAQWYNYLQLTYLDMAGCIEKDRGEPVPSSAAVGSTRSRGFVRCILCSY
jgi:hypothetical protein